MKTALRKNERVVNLLAFLLKSRCPVTLEEMRRDVDGYNDRGTSAATVARRFERDKAALRALGVEVLYSEDMLDVPGYFVPKPAAYMRGVELDAEEAQLLMALTAAAGHSDSPLAGNLASACQKLLAQTTACESPEGVSSRIVLYPAAVAQPRLASNLHTLAAAIESRSRCSFTYYAIIRGETSRRTLEPYGLKFCRGAWYVVGRCCDRDHVRTFRLDRIRDRVRRATQSAGRAYDVPPDFNIDEYVGASPWQLSCEKPVRVTVEFDDIGAWLLEESLPSDARVVRGSGGATASLAVRSILPFFKWVSSFGTHARIAAPREAADMFISFLEGLVRRCQA